MPANCVHEVERTNLKSTKHAVVDMCGLNIAVVNLLGIISIIAVRDHALAT